MEDICKISKSKPVKNKEAEKKSKKEEKNEVAILNTEDKSNLRAVTSSKNKTKREEACNRDDRSKDQTGTGFHKSKSEHGSVVQSNTEKVKPLAKEKRTNVKDNAYLHKIPINIHSQEIKVVNVSDGCGGFAKEHHKEQHDRKNSVQKLPDKTATKEVERFSRYSGKNREPCLIKITKDARVHYEENEESIDTLDESDPSVTEVIAETEVIDLTNLSVASQVESIILLSSEEEDDIKNILLESAQNVNATEKQKGFDQNDVIREKVHVNDSNANIEVINESNELEAKEIIGLSYKDFFHTSHLESTMILPSEIEEGKIEKASTLRRRLQNLSDADKQNIGLYKLDGIYRDSSVKNYKLDNETENILMKSEETLDCQEAKANRNEIEKANKHDNNAHKKIHVSSELKKLAKSEIIDLTNSESSDSSVEEITIRLSAEEELEIEKLISSIENCRYNLNDAYKQTGDSKSKIFQQNKISKESRHFPHSDKNTDFRNSHSSNSSHVGIGLSAEEEDEIQKIILLFESAQNLSDTDKQKHYEQESVANNCTGNDGSDKQNTSTEKCQEKCDTRGRKGNGNELSKANIYDSQTVKNVNVSGQSKPVTDKEIVDVRYPHCSSNFEVESTIGLTTEEEAEIQKLITLFENVDCNSSDTGKQTVTEQKNDPKDNCVQKKPSGKPKENVPKKCDTKEIMFHPHEICEYAISDSEPIENIDVFYDTDEIKNIRPIENIDVFYDTDEIKNIRPIENIDVFYDTDEIKNVKKNVHQEQKDSLYVGTTKEKSKCSKEIIDDSWKNAKGQRKFNPTRSNTPMNDKTGPYYIDRNLVPVFIYEEGLSMKHWNPTQVLYEICSQCQWSPPEFTLLLPPNYTVGDGFHFSVTVQERTFTPKQKASTKKQAKHYASTHFLHFLGFKFYFDDQKTVTNICRSLLHSGKWKKDSTMKDDRDRSNQEHSSDSEKENHSKRSTKIFRPKKPIKDTHRDNPRLKAERNSKKHKHRSRKRDKSSSESNSEYTASDKSSYKSHVESKRNSESNKNTVLPERPKLNPNAHEFIPHRTGLLSKPPRPPSPYPRSPRSHVLANNSYPRAHIPLNSNYPRAPLSPKNIVTPSYYPRAPPSPTHVLAPSYYSKPPLSSNNYPRAPLSSINYPRAPLSPNNYPRAPLSPKNYPRAPLLPNNDFFRTPISPRNAIPSSYFRGPPPLTHRMLSPPYLKAPLTHQNKFPPLDYLRAPLPPNNIGPPDRRMIPSSDYRHEQPISQPWIPHYCREPGRCISCLSKVHNELFKRRIL